MADNWSNVEVSKSGGEVRLSLTTPNNDEIVLYFDSRSASTIYEGIAEAENLATQSHLDDLEEELEELRTKVAELEADLESQRNSYESDLEDARNELEEARDRADRIAWAKGES